jgi:hypothetical protein
MNDIGEQVAKNGRRNGLSSQKTDSHLNIVLLLVRQSMQQLVLKEKNSSLNIQNQSLLIIRTSISMKMDMEKITVFSISQILMRQILRKGTL